MRDLAFFAIFLPIPFVCLLRPWLGMLVWTWFAFTYPMVFLWGFASAIPGNMIVTLATLVGWILAKDEPKIPPFDRTGLLFMALALMIIVSIILSLAPDYTAVKSSEYASIFIYLMLLSIFLRTPERIHGFVWMASFSIAYYAVKCSGFFIASGGAHQSSGPVGTQLYDNNHLAVAILVIIPLLNYLRLQARYHLVSLTLLATMILSGIAVISTYSRGGFIGLVCLVAYFWWNAGRKISHLVVMVIAVMVVVPLASEKWVSRMESIETAHESDGSFLSRLYAWELYWHAGLDRPLTGVGPKALEDPNVIVKYIRYVNLPPDEIKPRAAHSIYFQLIGELGFIAFGIYMALLYTSWSNGNWIARRTRGDPTIAWAGDLARMCQVSVVVFAISGAALSLVFFDLLLSILIMVAALRRLVAAKIGESQIFAPKKTASSLLTPRTAARAD